MNESEQPTAGEPLVAEVVSEPQDASGFRFGLKAMLVLVAICGFQFALMSYLGSLWGLLLGLALCWILFGVLIVVAILFHRRRHEPFMGKVNRLAIPMTLAIVVLTLAVMAAGGGWFIYDTVTRARRAAQLKHELGFRSARAYVIRDAVMVEAILVKSVEKGKPFDLAGVQRDDVVIVEGSVNEFYEILEENQGGNVTITVAADAQGKFLENCVLRQVDVSVPGP